MPEINENQPIRNEPVNHNNNNPQQPENREAPPVARAPRAENATTRREEVRQYGDEQRARLNNALPPNEREEEREPNAPLISGGLAGNSAAVFELNEQRVRDTGQITIRGDASTPANFVDNVERDLNRIAPGTQIERRPSDPTAQQTWDTQYGANTLAVVRPAQDRVSNHDQGYRLIDQLNNNSSPVNINYTPNAGAAEARYYTNAFGTPTQPGQSSSADVFYNPDHDLNLPVMRADGSIGSSPTSPAAILGHELVHASHAQRGTIDPNPGTTGGQHIFRVGSQDYREGDYRAVRLGEEFRTVGFPGSRMGSEPTENSLRRELGITEPRASYLDNVPYYQVDANNNFLFDNTGNPVTVNGHQSISSTEAFVGRNQQRFQNATNTVVDGVRNSRNSALMGGGVSAFQAIVRGEDAQGVLTDTAIGTGSGVTEEIIQRAFNGPASTTSGMTPNAFRTAASQVRGAAAAGAIINTAFTVHDQWDNLQNDATRSQAVGTIAGEAVVGAASGAAGAYAGAMAGAAIGSIVPGVGTVIGGVIGFAVGAAAGYLADQGLRGLGVDRMVAGAVTATYDAVSNVASQAGQAISNVASDAGQAISNAASSVAEGARNFFGGAASTLSSVFG